MRPCIDFGRVAIAIDEASIDRVRAPFSIDERCIDRKRGSIIVGENVIDDERDAIFIVRDALDNKRGALTIDEACIDFGTTEHHGDTTGDDVNRRQASALDSSKWSTGNTLKRLNGTSSTTLTSSRLTAFPIGKRKR